MSPKDVLILLDIIEKASKTPAYAHITGAAHDALLHAQLVALKHDDNNEEAPTRPTHAPTAPRRV